jgi:hypothetical protein
VHEFRRFYDLDLDTTLLGPTSWLKQSLSLSMHIRSPRRCRFSTPSSFPGSRSPTRSGSAGKPRGSCGREGGSIPPGGSGGS